MTTDTINVLDPVVQRLRTLTEDSPDLADAARLYEAILPLLRNSDLLVRPVSITPDQARSKMETGLPLLHGLELELDGRAVCDLMLQLARAVEVTGGGRQECNDAFLHTKAARRIREVLEENKLDFDCLLPGVAAGEKNLLTSSAQGLELDAGLLWILAQNALRPALRAWCRQLTPFAEGIPWYRGSCFICGADAILAELRGNNLAAHLRCGQCGADWQFRWLQCMHCGNEDHDTLGHFYPENQREKFRVEVCEKCRGYVKVITNFSPTPPEMLAVEDLATLHLDYIAQERGYTKPGIR